MGFKAINTVVFFHQFAVTGGIAVALTLGILAFNRTPFGYARHVRVIVSAIVAMGFAPSMIHGQYIAVFPAASMVLQGLVGTVRFSDGLVFGFVPWFVAYFLIYEIWKRCAKPWPKGEG